MTDIADQRNERQIRAAINQSVFREINENLETHNRKFIEVIPVGDFVCECADTACTARIGLTISEYERVRSEPTHFAVRHGHIVPEAEWVVEEHVGYAVVEKIEAAADYAETVNPRDI